jgi:hypothetical protein
MARYLVSYTLTHRVIASSKNILIHELVKGVYEVFGTHGLPDDPKQQELVMNAEDTLPAEIWDSRLGPVFWEKLQDAYPAEDFVNQLAQKEILCNTFGKQQVRLVTHLDVTREMVDYTVQQLCTI